MTMKLFGPASSKASTIELRIPVTNAAIITMTPTPTETPRIVKMERSLLALRETRPIETPSWSA